MSEPGMTTTSSFMSIAVVMVLSLMLLHRRSRYHFNQRLAFLDNVGGEFGPVAAADVLRRVDRSRRDEQHVAGLERHRRLAFDLIFQRAFEHIDDLFAGMR